MPKDVVTLFGQEAGERLIRKHCRRVGLPVADLRRLVVAVIDKSTLQRRVGLWESFDEVLSEGAVEESEHVS